MKYHVSLRAVAPRVYLPNRKPIMNRLQTVALALLCIVGAALPSRAALTFTSDIQADFEFSFLSSGPLDGYANQLGIPRDIFLDYRALGQLTFELDDSMAGATSLPFTSVTGQLAGILPQPIFSIQPIEFIGGSLDNIVRDGSNNIISADVNALSMRWEIVTFEGDAALQRRAITLEGLPFNGSVTGAPFGVGDVIAGPAPVNVFWDGDLVNPAAVVRNRTLTAVPEPASAYALLLGLSTVAIRRRRA